MNTYSNSTTPTPQSQMMHESINYFNTNFSTNSADLSPQANTNISHTISQIQTPQPTPLQSPTPSVAIPCSLDITSHTASPAISPNIQSTAIETTTIPELSLSGNNIQMETPVQTSDYNNNDINYGDEFMDEREKSLAQLGFNTTDIKDWEKIVQPQKPDMLSLLYNMITKYQKTNLQILIGRHTFNCHMLVLQCYSEFFMGFSTEQVLVLPEEKVTPEAFITVYDWMLAKTPVVQRDGILEVFNAATFLSIKGLIDQCWVCLDDDERFSEDAAFMLYLEARKFKHDLIQQLMLTRICKFFLTLVSSKEFLELTCQEVCNLLGSNSIGVYAESEVFMAAIRWLHFNYRDRQIYIVDIMKTVRFGLMAPWQLVELRRNKASIEIQQIVELPEVQTMIDDGLSYVTTKYYYVTREKDFLICLERLQLSEPIERQWIRDELYQRHRVKTNDLSNKNLVSYQKFNDYLAFVKEQGKEHWRTLAFNEDGPAWESNIDVNTSADNNIYLDEFVKAQNLYKN